MNHFLISLLGDGVFDRWGEECPELESELTRLYTQSSFSIENHGLLNSRSGNGLWRINADYEKHGVKRRNLSLANPHVVVIESFAFTQYWDGPEGLTEYRDLLRRIWDEIERTTTAQRLFCLAAPPPREYFLEGVRNFQNSSKATRGRFADTVKMYLDEARAIAQDESWPVADVGAELERVLENKTFARRYFDQSENVYPSKLGYQLLARVIVRALDNERMIEEKTSK